MKTKKPKIQTIPGSEALVAIALGKVSDSITEVVDTTTSKALAALLALIVTNTQLHADTFGSGDNTFTIDFVSVGNSSNGDDAGAGGGSFFSPYGKVDYTFRMGTYEVSQDAITKATNLGMTNVEAGDWSASLPATSMTWYEAVAFVNWLNTSTGHQAAYDLSYSGGWTMNLWSSGQAWQAGGENLFRHKDAYYFLPSEDEWYKAAYHKNDGVTANYWDYATGSNSIPDGIDFNGDTSFDAVFSQGYGQLSPNGVTNVGIASPYGTYGQNGNVYEWNESAYDSLNNSSSENRAIRGGYWFLAENNLRSSSRFSNVPSYSGFTVGVRVASVPEPSVVPPVLAITSTGPTTALISWPSPSAGWSLEENATPSGGVWTPPAEPITDDGTNKSVTIGTTNASRFFRLAQ